jgi:hypothetical protein
LYPFPQFSLSSIPYPCRLNTRLGIVRLGGVAE